MPTPSVSRLSDADKHTLIATARELYQWHPRSRRCSLRKTSPPGLPPTAMPGYVLGVAAEILGHVPGFQRDIGIDGNINVLALAELLFVLNDRLTKVLAQRFARLIIEHGNRQDRNGTYRFQRKALFWEQRNPTAKYRHRRKRRRKQEKRRGPQQGPAH